MIRITKLKSIDESEARTSNILKDPKFTSWFNGSKVVDSNGLPLVCYHGTKVNFDSFRPLSHFGTVGASNMFVSTDYSFNDQIVPVYLSIKNPLKILDNDNYSPDLGFDMYQQEFISYDEMIDIYDNLRYGKNLNDKIEEINQKFNFDLNSRRPNYSRFLAHGGYKINVKKFISIFQQKGYDGMYYTNTSEDYGSTSWIIFSSDQVWPIYKNNPDNKVEEGLNEGIDQYKHIMKNDWDYPEELMIWLMTNGFKKIGRGSFSTTYAKKNENIVLKVIGTGKWSQEDEMFDHWYSFCKSNKSSHLPKYGSLKDFECDGKKYQLVYTEKLNEIDEDDVFMCYAIGDIIKYFYDHKEMSEEDFNKIVEYVDEKQIKEIQPMIPTLKDISKSFPLSNIDSRPDNFMRRSDGTLVINDIIGQRRKYD